MGEAQGEYAFFCTPAIAIDGGLPCSAVRLTMAAAGRAAPTPGLAPLLGAGVEGWLENLVIQHRQLGEGSGTQRSSSHWVEYVFSTLVKTNIEEP